MADVTINKKLNLVLPVTTNAGTKIWVHSVPLSREVFESNYMLLVKVLANMYANGIGPAMAPRIAALVLRTTAKEMNNEEDISASLMQEIYRLTNFLLPTPNGGGWQTMPFIEAKNRKLVDEDNISEVENAIVYFIVASAVHLKSELPMAYGGLKSIWNAETTSSTVTEYGRSLKILTKDESTGEKVAEIDITVVPAPPPPRLKSTEVKLSSIPS
jgi:hypothetical protein